MAFVLVGIVLGVVLAVLHAASAGGTLLSALGLFFLSYPILTFAVWAVVALWLYLRRNAVGPHRMPPSPGPLAPQRPHRERGSTL